MNGMEMIQPQSKMERPSFSAEMALEMLQEQVRSEQMEYGFAVSNSENLKGLKYKNSLKNVLETTLVGVLTQGVKMPEDQAMDTVGIMGAYLSEKKNEIQGFVIAVQDGLAKLQERLTIFAERGNPAI